MESENVCAYDAHTDDCYYRPIYIALNCQGVRSINVYVTF